MKKVSVVVPCYNSSESIYRCWESIKRQSIGIESVECIFVDDCSTDDGKTITKLNVISSMYPDNVKVIFSDINRGPGGALNMGISVASGKYLQIIGADDELLNEALENLYTISEKYSTDIIQYNHTLILNGQKKVNFVSRGNELFEIDSYYKRVELLNATKVTYGCTNKFYRMDLIKNTGVRFAENVVYEEPLFVYPLFLYANRVYFCEEGFYQYYLHSDSIVTSKIGKNLLDHPKVQLMLLEDCMKRTELYEEYKDVIECYFLWSFYCETLLFASEHSDSYFPLEYFREMQQICKKLYPDWGSNEYIARVDKKTIDMLKTLNRDFSNQRELDNYINSLS